LSSGGLSTQLSRWKGTFSSGACDHKAWYSSSLTVSVNAEHRCNIGDAAYFFQDSSAPVRNIRTFGLERVMTRRLFLLRIAFATFLILCAQPLFAAGGDKLLHSFNAQPAGYGPSGGFVSDAAGNLYGAAYGGAYGAGVVFELSQNSQGGWRERAIYAFSNGYSFDGESLAIDAAGNLYGTGFAGYPNGMIYRLQPSSDRTWNFSILYQFTQSIGGFTGPLAMDANGNLYGELRPGLYSAKYGSVFELTPSGGVWTEKTIYQFSGNNGSGPWDGLTVDGKGNLYGVTNLGGPANGGVAFELAPSSGGSWTETVLHAFNCAVDDGCYPDTRLVFDQSGNLFGTASYPGTTCNASGGCGLVFELKPGSNGQWTESLVYSFRSASGFGVRPTGVVFDALGNLYGSTTSGGNTYCDQGCGTVFELSPSSGGQWTQTVLYNFSGGSDGYSPSNVILGSGGQLYGEIYFSGINPLGLVFQLTAAGPPWQDTNIFTFTPSNDGEYAFSTLVPDATGNLYGVTSFGGEGYGLGGATVFEVTPLPGGGWTTSTIFSFSSSSECCPSPLILDKFGNLYGTIQNLDYGSVFELSPVPGGWVLTYLYSFQGGSAGGPPTKARLTMDSAGNLYGTALTNSLNGIVYELSLGSQGWTKTTLHNFAGKPDGSDPGGEVIFDPAGKNLYGTTYGGGADGKGTVYELSPSSGTWSETVLYSFTGADGANPVAGLVFDKAGNLYGTTSFGGAAQLGTVFMLSPSGGGWTETVLHSFLNTGSDGTNPAAGLTLDASGNLYGTTSFGGAAQLGTVFMLSPSSGGWNETILHAFTGQNGPDGGNPDGRVIFGTNGNLFGTTVSGGKTNQGTVFEMRP
jgi:uncharacterized repeat protein (TIGR03803 family)